MNNLEWLDSLSLDELTAWMGAEHGTNGNADGTNGIADGFPLVARDPVEIMRSCCDMKHGMGSLRKSLGIECVSGWQMRCLKALADMVERDYVRKDGIPVPYSRIHAECHELQKQVDELTAERDEWKAKAEGSSKVRAGSSKSAKRAVAVERLRMLDKFGGGSFEYAILGSDKMAWSYMDKRDALIDLLTDDDGAARSMSNLEWLYENDLRKLCDLCIDGDMSCSDCPNQCVETEEGTPPEECQRRLLEWLMAPHEDAHSDAPSLRDLYGIFGEEDAPETPDSAEIPQKTGEQGREGDGFADSRENLGSDLGSNLGSGSEVGSEADSREKLEADVRQLAFDYAPSSDSSDEYALRAKIMNLLDRQDAITKGEWCTERGWWDSAEECNRATALCYEKDERITELQAEIAKRDEGIERLKRQRDEARAQLDADWPKLLRCLENDYGIAASWDGLRKIWLTERADGSAVDAVREFAARYEQRIAELEAERDGWRMRCGTLLDAAHAMQTVADSWEVDE